MTDQQLRTAMQHLADEVTVVDLRPRVRARTRVLRRRRRMAAVAAPVAAVAVAAALLSTPSGPESAPPAGRTPVPTVDLTGAPTGGLAGAVLSVVDTASGNAWLVTAGGRTARLPVRIPSPSGALPTLSADGTVLSFGGPGRATLVRSEDGAVTEISLPDAQENLVSVSPDGRTIAYAAGNRVDAVELTLVPLDDSPPSTLPVTTSKAAGALVPVVWSDDGSSLLVLEGAGATRVDLEPSPRAGRGVYVKDDLVLAHGWAAAPDLSRLAMSSASSLGGERRRWHVLASDDGRTTDELNRPADDRLIGWTADDRLVWWHRTAGGYYVLTTDTAGRSMRRELRVSSRSPALGATWTADRG